jgi:hypothetical protein
MLKCCSEVGSLKSASRYMLQVSVKSGRTSNTQYVRFVVQVRAFVVMFGTMEKRPGMVEKTVEIAFLKSEYLKLKF